MAADEKTRPECLAAYFVDSMRIPPAIMGEFRPPSPMARMGKAEDCCFSMKDALSAGSWC